MARAVEDFQRKLADLGFDPGPVDGIIGRQTAAAFEAFLTGSDMTFNVRARAGKLDVTGPLPHRLDSTHPVPWMGVAYSVMGLHEVRDNAALKAFLRSDGATLGDPSRFPWCGDFVQTCISLALPEEKFTGKAGENPYLARNWERFGSACKPSPGAILVFWRGNPRSIYGHVGFYLGEDDTSYYVAGGNQSNGVSVARIAKDRLVAARWPETTDLRPTGPRFIEDPSLALSVNEA